MKSIHCSHCLSILYFCIFFMLAGTLENCRGAFLWWLKTPFRRRILLQMDTTTVAEIKHNGAPEADQEHAVEITSLGGLVACLFKLH